MVPEALGVMACGAVAFELAIAADVAVVDVTTGAAGDGFAGSSPTER